MHRTLLNRNGESNYRARASLGKSAHIDFELTKENYTLRDNYRNKRNWIKAGALKICYSADKPSLFTPGRAISSVIQLVS